MTIKKYYIIGGVVVVVAAIGYLIFLASLEKEQGRPKESIELPEDNSCREINFDIKKENLWCLEKEGKNLFRVSIKEKKTEVFFETKDSEIDKIFWSGDSNYAIFKQRKEDKYEFTTWLIDLSTKSLKELPKEITGLAFSRTEKKILYNYLTTEQNILTVANYDNSERQQIANLKALISEEMKIFWPVQSKAFVFIESYGDSPSAVYEVDLTKGSYKLVANKVLEWKVTDRAKHLLLHLMSGEYKLLDSSSAQLEKLKIDPNLVIRDFLVLDNERYLLSAYPEGSGSLSLYVYEFKNQQLQELEDVLSGINWIDCSNLVYNTEDKQIVFTEKSRFYFKDLKEKI